jgi:hypothetical protein
VLACLCVLAIGRVTARADAFVTDIFGRDVSSFGLTVPDWEGYMANPAIQFTITPPPQAISPLKVTLSTVEPRLYFDLPSKAGSQGAVKDLVFTSAAPQRVFIAVFPAREKRNEETFLTIQLLDGGGRRAQVIVPIHIVTVKSQHDSRTFPIVVDFSQDRTGFYRDPEHRAVFQQAAADWAFYLRDMQLQPVAAGQEKTWIWEPDGFRKCDLVTNASDFTGFLLYAYGINGPQLRSGGESSSAGGFQQTADGTLPVRRSGGVETEVLGNYNTLHWMSPLIADEQWWQATNLQDVPNDLYSILHHEIGHALFFHPDNPKFPRNGVLKDAAIRAYLGTNIKTDLRDHFDGFIDPASLHGAFGNEYHGKTPYGRWLITKLDLLCAQAVGYKLRDVAPLLPLSIQTDSLPIAPLRRAYDATFSAQGGIPVYDWQVDTGSLPRGLHLDRFTGRITGAATRAGDYRCTVKVRDYDAHSPGVSREYHITVSG